MNTPLPNLFIRLSASAFLWPFNKRPFILLTRNYKEGEQGNTYTHGDYGQHRLGEEAGKVQKDNEKRFSSSGGGNTGPDGRAGDFWGRLILFVVVAFMAVPSAFSAVAGSLLMLAVFAVFKDRSEIDYSTLLKAAFWTAFAYLSVAAVMAFLQPYIWHGEMMPRDRTFIATLVKYFFAFTDPEIRQTMPPEILLKFHGICTIIPALILYGKLSLIPKGFLGFLGALLMTVLFILPSLLAFFYLFARLLPKQFEWTITLF